MASRCDGGKSKPTSAAGDANVGVNAQERKPHRPSRRHEILDAAVAVFAERGFTDTSIQEVSDRAGVVPTAVYYHFGTKEDLFEIGLRSVIDASSDVVYSTRPTSSPARQDSFRSVVAASWDWMAANPQATRMLFSQMPGGATPGTRKMVSDYEDRHINRAFDYLPVSDEPTGKRAAAGQHASRSLRVKTMIATTIAIQPLRLEDGPLSKMPMSQLRAATIEVCERMMGD